MKAKEYAAFFKRLGDKDISNDEFARLVYDLFREMLEEMSALIEVRHIRSDAGFVSLLMEFNTKGNAISDILGGSLNKNWFVLLYEDAKQRVLQDEAKRRSENGRKGYNFQYEENDDGKK